MNKKELITQLEHIIETLREEDVIINRASVDHTLYHDTNRAYDSESRTTKYVTFKGSEDFDIHIDLEHRIEKEVD
ncbi:hypothetical protein [Salinicoccus halodurans]|uniref:Uncharacterized protein n=1 Tax=Salinicoccus halodurans TaxID=407035 RepID=A0A0F7HMY8_9STAP|nr:hypothetical protein [Salinicoccus halodurans]AKG74394.1 hypothetical protein AAT16_09205 [Salinicoccus halodurans]SFK95394.1 hypothetical protein SAMN05216235_2740 [Salinicoccus halodurans]